MGNSCCAVEDLGVQGPPGFIWTGPYDSTRDYIKTDGVQFNGSAYICIQPNTGIAPTGSPTDPYWSLFAQGSASGGTSLAQTLFVTGYRA